jgi:4-diphosphocytidyl-2-C-methyl-D-erythritol kinase
MATSPKAMLKAKREAKRALRFCLLTTRSCRRYKLKAMKVTCQSWAKINLLLRVCGRRDDGFHELQTIFQTVDLADQLSFATLALGPTQLEVSGSEAPSGEDNLVLRAVKALEEHCGTQLPPLRIALKKCIPVGAGLGGGSSNAAATLVALNRMLQLGFDRERLERIGAELGADVPLFIRGGTQLGRGRGDQLEPLPSLDSTPLVLVKPDFSISTTEAYGLLKGRELPPPLTEMELGERIAALRQGNWAAVLENTFEDALADHYPALAQIKDTLLSHGCIAALLSGSGSTVFGIAPDRKAARAIADRLKKEYPFSRPVVNFIGPRANIS